MANFLLVQLIATAVFAITQGQELTGQEVFCQKLENECPEYLVQGVVCASSALNYPNECEFWRENCRRKTVQRMTLAAREPCSDDYCPAHCRGEIRDLVCGSFLTAAGDLRKKNYRNYCKFREAKCKLLDTADTKVNYLFHGDCASPPPTTPKPEVVTVKKQETTTVAVVEEEEREEGRFVTDLIDVTVLETEEMEDLAGTEVMFVTEEVLATVLIDGTPVPVEERGTPSPEEYATTIIYEEVEQNETIVPVDLEGTPSPGEEEEETTPGDFETEIVTLEEEEETDEMVTEIMEVVETEAPMQEDMVTEIMEVVETEAPMGMPEDMVTEEEGTASPEDVEETLAPEDLEETPAPEDLEETPAPEDLEGTVIPDELTTAAAADEEEVPELVELLTQCMDQYQNCFDEVPSTNEVIDIIGFFFDCLSEFQSCLAEDPTIGGQDPIQAPELGPS